MGVPQRRRECQSTAATLYAALGQCTRSSSARQRTRRVLAWRYVRKELLMLITYTAIFADGEDGWIIGWVRELSGAIVQERTIEEARQSLQEVILQILATRDANDKEYTIIAREPITVDI
jgi:predicted RNase H-like HicB family nuclease